jgi:hypothetical protein
VLRSGLPVRITDYHRLAGPVARLAWGLGIYSTIGAPIFIEAGRTGGKPKQAADRHPR